MSKQVQWLVCGFGINEIISCYRSFEKLFITCAKILMIIIKLNSEVFNLRPANA
jgi:hypothetical protein